MMTKLQRTRRLVLAAKRKTVAAARPSWITGAGRLVDIGGTFNRYAILTSPVKSESQALADDWAVVGADLDRAMDRIAPSLKEK